MPTLPFSTFQQLDLPLTEVVSGRIGFIHDLFLAFPFEIRDSLPDDGGDLVVLVDKRDRAAKLTKLAGYEGRIVLVAAPGDSPFRGVETSSGRSVPANVTTAFATSNETTDHRVTSVPLGVRSSKLRALKFVRQNRSSGRRKLLYANFTVNDEHYRPDRRGQPHIRVRLADRLRHQPWLTYDVSTERRDTPEELIQYYSQIASHRFVLSPEGNGIDCYRTWEALSLGAIPIIMSSKSMEAFSSLPVLMTEDYTELSQEYLEREWEVLSSRSYEMEAMLTSTYLRRFLQAVGRLESPRFVCWDFAPEKFVDALRLSSRSSARVLAESPTAPFTASGDLGTPDGWHAPGALRVVHHEDGLEIVIDGSGKHVAETPLQTIAGAPFRLTGRVLKKGVVGLGRLVVDVEERPDVIAAVEIADRTAEIALDFVARSDRTVLSIRAPEAESGAAWILSDLSLGTDL